MGSRALVGFSVAVLLLAGCAEKTSEEMLPTGSEAAPTQSDAAPSTLFDADGSAPLPIWNIGDWWEYDVSYSSGESYSAKVAVHSEDGGNYYVTSDSRELLLRAAFTHYPTFGTVTKSSLQHMIHGAEVAFLKFPMKNQTWEAPYRDFTGAYTSAFNTLSTGKGAVPGFETIMTNAADGNVRMVNGWSPVTKYFTTFTWDFDGVAPIDVEFHLKDWGTNFTGSVPVFEITEGVHRTFPTAVVAAPPAGPPTAGPDNRATFSIPTGATMLVGMFAGAGGPGDFEMQLVHQGGTTSNYPWRPTAPGSYFDWDEREGPPGEWSIVGTGAAQNFAFLFLETYGIKTVQVELGA